MSSFPRNTDGKANEHQVQVAEEETVGSSSSGRRLNNNTTTTTNKSFPHQFSLLPNKKSKVEESDEDLFTVPDVETPTPISSAVMANVYGNHNTEENSADQTGLSVKRRRGRNPVDKEYRRIKRLLRNRVSAQQARERKKVYVNELESKANELQDRNLKLEEKISTLINENTMLRKVLMNTRPKNDESEQNQDRLGKS